MSTEQREIAPEEQDEGTRAASPESPTFVVGIGASAGGLEPIERFFDHMPSGMGLAFVLVQHLSPDFKSLMDELLARHTQMKIQRVTEGMTVEANCIYLIPPKKNMVLSEGQLRLTDFAGSGTLNLPIDAFFRSLATEVGKRSIAVVLSGTGSDGSRGIVDVHEAGGLVLVQSVESSLFDGMPRNAVSSGVADVVCEPERMAETILRYVEQPDAFVQEGRAGAPIPVDETDLEAIYRMFRHRYGIDFSQYKSTTISRRIERRMKLMRTESLTDYLQLLERDLPEVEALFRDLLVEVTSFFRDPQAFEILRRDVIPTIVEGVQTGDHVRVWVPGCATGEEAYSLAMLFQEAASRKTPRPEVKVFATDVFRHSLETASIGIYSPESLNRVPADLRARYFLRHGDLYQVSQEIRKLVVFAPHDITKDPPFTKIDLLSCRNVLIYFDPEVQRRVIANFHFALRVQGFMFLGPSETPGVYEREFQNVDTHWKIFRKLRDIRLSHIVGGSHSSHVASAIPMPSKQVVRLPTRSDNIVENVFDDLLERFVPPSFLVDAHFDLIHSFGKAREMLVQPRGRPTLEVLKLVDGDLRVALTSALHRARRDMTAVAYKDIDCEIAGVRQRVDVSVEPFEKRQQKMFLVCMQRTDQSSADRPQAEAETFHLSDQAQQRLQDMERELHFTKESLQSTVEELETSNEELQSTNEELVAANEELQSTNEELHSVNEELYTVNAEHQRKIDELTQMTSDMDNLLQSTEIGTIFLDRQLRIRKFTPAIAAAFHVMEQDVGRPITHIAYHLDNADLIEHIQDVMRTGEVTEREVRSRDGRSYLKTIRPYRTNTGEIEGAVISFFEVSAVKQAERQLELVLDNTPSLIAYLDRTLRIKLVNQQFADYVRLRKEQLIGQDLKGVLGSVAFDEMEPYFSRVLEGHRQVFEHRNVTLRSISYWSVVLLPDIRKGEFTGVFFALNEITQLKRGSLLGAAIDASPTAIVMIDERGLISLVNQETENLFGYSRDALIGHPVEILVPERYARQHEMMRRGYFQQPKARRMGANRELFGRRADGSEVPVEIGLNPIQSEEGVFVLAAIVDISERWAINEKLRVSVQQSPVATLLVTADGNVDLANLAAAALLGRDRQEIERSPLDKFFPCVARDADALERLARQGSESPEAPPRVWTARRPGNHDVPLEVRASVAQLNDQKCFVLTCLEPVSK